MSATIDERVVEMRFDNKQFESNAKESLGTLEKLKQALNFSASTKSFEDLEKAANGVDMNGLGSAVESVKLKFSALEVMAITALSNITNRAIDAGVNLVKSLSIDQISAGWQKYADKTSAVQTIMAATAKEFTDTGEQMEYVNEQLDKLNWFTDETSYNFVDMVGNIGKFTSNNIQLEKSVTAMQGIATWAAISGANSQAASRAMYNLSQAIGLGAVKVQDWASIESANMATAEFKETAMETAASLGLLTKSANGVYKTFKGNEVTIESFRTTLADTWFTSEVLVSTLNKYGGFTDKLYEMIDAMESEYITTSRVLKAIDEYKAGTLDISAFSVECGMSVSELTKYLDILSDETMDLGRRSLMAAQEAKTFQEAIDATKDAVSTGWMNTFEIIFGNYEEAKVLWTDFANFLYEVFAESGYMRNEILSGWKEAGGRDDLFDGIKASWRALMSVIEPVKEAWDYIFPPKSKDERVQGLVNLTRKFKELMEHLKLSDSASDKLKRTFQGLFAIVNIVKRTAGALISIIAPGAKAFTGLGGGILSVTASLGDCLVALDEFLKKHDWLTKAAEKLHKVLGIGISKAKEFINVIKDWVNSHFKSPDTKFITDFADTVETRLTPLKSIFNFFGKGFKAILGVLTKVAPTIAKLASIIGKALASLGAKITEMFTGDGFNALFDLFNGGLMAAIGVGVAKFINNLANIVKDGSSIVGGIKEIKNAVLDTFGAFQSQLKSKTLMNIAKAIAVLTASLVVLSLIDSEKLGACLATIGGLFIELFGSIVIFEKIMKKSGMESIRKISTSLIILSSSILILSVAMKAIGSIDSKKLLGSLAAISVLIAEMTGVAIVLSKYGGKIKTGAVGIIAFSVSILILSKAVKSLGSLDVKQLTKGLIGVGILLAELAAFMAAAKFGKFKPTQAVGLLVLSASLIVLQKAVAAFGKMDVKEITKGLIAVAAVLGELAAFSVAAGYSKHVISTSLAMVIMAEALVLLQKPMEAFGNMSMKEIGKGLLVMGGALAEIALALRVMPSNSISVSLGLLAVSASLTIISKVIQTMAAMSWQEVAKGLITLGIALAELAIAMNLMEGTLSGAAAMLVMSVSLIALTKVLTTLGKLGWDQIIKGLVSLAAAFTIVGVAGSVLGPLAPQILALSGALALLGVAVALAGIGLVNLAAGFASLAASGVAACASIIAMIEVLIVGLVNVIKDTAVAIVKVLIDIVKIICQVIITCVPDIVKTLLVLIKEVLAALAENAPDIVHHILVFLIGIIDALASDLPVLIQSVVNLFMAFFAGVVEALKGVDTKVLIEGIAGVGLISAMMIALAALSMLAPAAMLGVLAFGGIVAELAIVLAAIGAISKIPGLKWFIGEGSELLKVIGIAIGKFLGGIAGGFMNGVSSQFPRIGQDLSDFMYTVQPFIEGASKINRSTTDGVKALTEVVLLMTAANVLNGLTSWFTGGSSVTKFGEELAEFGPYFSSYYESVKNVKGDVVKASADAALSLAEMASKLPNRDGVVGWFCGENSLSVFAEELADFGPSLKKYADSVDGLNPDVVTASANAALSLAEMAEKLPNRDGVVGWFSGENSLSTFADELSKFGPALKSYSVSVKGLEPEVVSASASAALSLAELASNLPDKGGIKAWFSGDNTLSKFGKELSKFGPYIKEYSDSISEMKPDVVRASGEAALALAKLASDLPTTGGIKSWFSGDNDISDFGKKLVKFGKAISDYYISISETKPDVIIKSAEAAKELLDIAKGSIDIDSSNLKSIGKDLKKFGKDLAEMGPDLSTYYESIKDIEASKIRESSDIFSSLAEMTSKLPDQGGIKTWFVGDNTLSVFGKELSKFGPYIKEYSSSLTGLDSSVVKASADSALALSEMASKLPDQGGIKTWFIGDNKLSDFAKELSAFGPSIKEYSDSIDGFDPETVRSSADSALVLSEFAQKLPNQGGIKSWFIGGSTLSAFGKELSKFGPHIREYSDTVDGLKPEVVTASADAALSLAKMAANLPDQGGLVSWFVGDNRLSVFGKELSAFGPYIAEYSKSVTDVKPEAVTASASAALSLAELANNLPTSGGIKSWFTGDNNIGKFGENLSKFGTAISEYYVSISGITFSTLSDSIENVRKIISLAKDIETVQSSALAEFGNNLKKLGKTGVDDFVNGFKDSNDKIKDAVSKMIGYATSALEKGTDEISKSSKNAGSAIAKGIESGATGEDKSLKEAFKNLGTTIINTLKSNLPANTFTTIGSDSIAALISGINSQKQSAYNTIETLGSSMVNRMRASLPNSTFNDIGKNMVVATASGIDSGKKTIEKSATNISNAAIDAVKKKLSYKGFYDIGAYAAEGLSKGITSKIKSISSAASSAAATAITTAKKTLQVHSPSRIFIEIGKFVSLGLANGILKNISTIAAASRDLADTAIDPVQAAAERISAILEEGDAGLNPVITPVIDLSKVSEGAEKVSSIFKGLDLSSAYDKALEVSSSVNRYKEYKKRNSSSSLAEGFTKSLGKLSEKSQQVFNNTFNITSTDPKGVAEEVSKKIQSEVERRKAVWE